MKIAFVVARVGEERNVIQKLALLLAGELRKLGDQVDVQPFTRKGLFKILPTQKLNTYDCVLIANVGLQCAYYSLYKRLGLLRKPFAAISFGSDMRATDSVLINLFNSISKPAISLLIVVGPDLEPLARRRGYKNVHYVPSWAGVLA